MEISNSDKRCSRCISPETFPGADLAEEETCTWCRQHTPFEPLGEDKLRALLTSQKGEEYDCIVPVSGGKDSTYVLYYVTQELGLSALAVNYDSGFQSALAMENAERVCERLRVPLVRKSVDREWQLKMLREIMNVSEAVESFFHVCGNCETGIRTSALSVAREYGAPFIIMGDDRNEILLKYFSFQGTRAFLKRLAARKKMIPRVMYHLAKYLVLSFRQCGEMGVPLRWRFQTLRPMPWPENGPEVIHFFDYASWEPDKMTAFIQEKLGWKSPAGYEARFDCLLHCFGNHHWLQEVGISNDAFIDCEVLREGGSSRQEVLEKEQLRAGKIEADCRKSLAEIGVEPFRLPPIRP